MTSTLQKQSNSTAVLTISVPHDDLAPYLEQATQEINREVRIAGFRPGKAPRDILERQVGAMRIYQHAAEKVVAATYPEAVVEHNLQTIGTPEVSVEKLAPGNELVYTATVALVPQIKLGSYSKIREAHKEVTVTDDEITTTIARLRRMFGTERPVDRPIQTGDVAEIDLEVFRDNVPIEGGSGKKQRVVIGEKNFIPGFEDALIGAKKGETKEFSLTFPKQYHAKHLAGQLATFRVTVQSVAEVDQPELDDAFAKTVGKFDTLAALREQITKNIIDEKTEKEQQRWELAIIDQLIQQTTFDPIPEILITNELDRMLHELEHDVSHQGMKFEDYLQSIKKDRASLRTDLTPRAERRVKTALILRALAAAEKITVDEAELTAAVEKEQLGASDQPETLKQLQSPEYRDYLRTILRNRKVFDYYRERSRA